MDDPKGDGSQRSILLNFQLAICSSGVSLREVEMTLPWRMYLALHVCLHAAKCLLTDERACQSRRSVRRRGGGMCVSLVSSCGFKELYLHIRDFWIFSIFKLHSDSYLNPRWSFCDHCPLSFRNQVPQDNHLMCACIPGLAPGHLK